MQTLFALSSPEMAALLQRVASLAALVEKLSATSQGREASDEEFVAALDAYSAFLTSLRVVEDAVFGARPFKETQWWVRILQRWRYYVCSFFSWGILPEAQVVEVGKRLKALGVEGIVDPLAGSGWHARLWRSCAGLHVVAADSYPVRFVAWSKVLLADARELKDGGMPPGSAASAWALFLSWPPHSPETVGQDLLAQWPGEFVVFLGERSDALEGEEGVTGGRAFLTFLEAKFERVCTVDIPHWPGYMDDLSIYRRRPSQTIT